MWIIFHPSRSSVSWSAMTAATCPTDIRRHLPYRPSSHVQISTSRGWRRCRVGESKLLYSEDEMPAARYLTAGTNLGLM